MGLKRIDGSGLDGTLVTATFGKIMVKLLKASFGDSIEPTFLAHMGSQTQDEQSDGTYKTEEFSITMSSLEFRTVFMAAMPATGGGNVRFSTVIGVSHPDMGEDSDMLENCRITNWAAAWENSGKVAETELKGTVQQIYWTDARKTINRQPNVAVSQSAF